MHSNLRSMTRQERIMSIMLEVGSTSVGFLEARLGVSSWTVRRDLDGLEAAGLVSRRYGSVTALRMERMRELVGPDEPEDGDASVRRSLGAAAARLVRPGQDVAIAAGPASMEAAQALRERDVRCRVVTNGLEIAQRLLEARRIEVVCTGGEVDRHQRTMNGIALRQALHDKSFDLAIIDVEGITAQEGLTVGSAIAASSLSLFLGQSRTAVVVADHARFGVAKFAQVAPLHCADVIVTDRRPEPAILNHMTANGSRLIVASEAPRRALERPREFHCALSG